MVRLSKPPKLSKASRTLKASKTKASPKSPPITYTLPEIDFPNIPQPLIKSRSTALLPSTQSTIPSPSKRQSPKKTTRQRTKRTKELVDEVIEPLEIVTTRGRRSKRRLFHDEVLAKALANQKEA
jgi:hypothetical protein